MFDFDQPLLVAGLLLGLSSSLHCFGMCSGIAASLHFAADLDPKRPARDLVADDAADQCRADHRICRLRA